MRFFPYALVSFLFLLLTASLSGAAGDWRVDSYDKAEALFVAFEQNEAELLKQYEPKLAEFSQIFIPYQDAVRKMQRYEFLKMVRENPESMDWTGTWDWANGVNSGTKKQEELAAQDPAYRALREDFLAKKEILRQAKEITKLRNAVYEKHAESFHALELKLFIGLQALQAEVDQLMENPQVAPSP